MTHQDRNEGTQPKEKVGTVAHEELMSEVAFTGAFRAQVTTDVKPILEKGTFLFDLDGTVWVGNTLLPNAIETLDALRNSGRRTIFFTNNSSKSREEYYERLSKLNVCESPDEIVMSTDTVISWLQQHNYSRAYVLGTPAMKGMLNDAGILHVSDPTQVQVVVIGFDKTATAEKLTEVARLIVNHKVPYIVAHPDPFCPSDEGPIVDCGAYYACIKTATRVEAQAILGKPGESMVAEVEKRFDIPRGEMIVFGDRLYTDVAIGSNAGIDSVLVLSGENQLEDVAASEHKPTYILNSIADLLPSLSN